MQRAEGKNRISYVREYMVRSAFATYVRILCDTYPSFTPLCLPNLVELGRFHQQDENGLAAYARQPYSEESVSQLVNSCSQFAELVWTLCGKFHEHSRNSAMPNHGFRRKNSSNF